MEKNNEKLSRPYVAPETDVIRVETGRILDGSPMEDGGEGGIIPIGG